MGCSCTASTRPPSRSWAPTCARNASAATAPLNAPLAMPSESQPEGAPFPGRSGSGGPEPRGGAMPAPDFKSTDKPLGPTAANGGPFQPGLGLHVNRQQPGPGLQTLPDASKLRRLGDGSIMGAWQAPGEEPQDTLPDVAGGASEARRLVCNAVDCTCCTCKNADSNSGNVVNGSILSAVKSIDCSNRGITGLPTSIPYKNLTWLRMVRASSSSSPYLNSGLSPSHTY